MSIKKTEYPQQPNKSLDTTNPPQGGSGLQKEKNIKEQMTMRLKISKG